MFKFFSLLNFLGNWLTKTAELGRLVLELRQEDSNFLMFVRINYLGRSNNANMTVHRLSKTLRLWNYKQGEFISFRKI